MFDKETTLPILLTVMCALLLAVVLLFGFNTGRFDFLKNKNQKQVAVQKEEEKIVRTDYTDVARKTLDWIGQQRNEEGWYILERFCTPKEQACNIIRDNVEGNRDGLVVSWARLNFYEQHKNPKDIDIIKTDIDIFYNKYKANNLKDSLWLCRIAYSMNQSDYLDDETKIKLENLCVNFNTPDLFEPEKKWQNRVSDIENKMKETKIWESWNGYDLVLRGFSSYFTYPSDLVSRYAWKKNKFDLDQARKYLESIKNIVKNDKNINTEESCLVGISSLDVYELGGKNVEDLEYTKNLFDVLINDSDDPRRVQTPFCGLMTKQLYKITKEAKYLSSLEFNNRILVEINLDGGVNKIVSDGSFMRSNLGLLFAPNKNVVENALIVELIRD